MRKTIPYLAAWVAAGLLAVTMSSIGVSMVTEQVTGSRPAPLSSDEVQDELAAGPTGTGSVTSITSSTTADSPITTLPGGTTATTTPSSSSSGSVGGSGTATTVPSGSSGGPGGSGSSGGSGSGGTPVSPPATTPSAPPTTASSSVTKTYDLVGGTTTLRVSASGVTVVVATPKAGYSVDIGSTHDSGARVEFRNDAVGHRSRIDAWWDAGPQQEIREEG